MPAWMQTLRGVETGIVFLVVCTLAYVLGRLTAYLSLTKPLKDQIYAINATLSNDDGSISAAMTQELRTEANSLLLRLKGLRNDARGWTLRVRTHVTVMVGMWALLLVGTQSFSHAVSVGLIGTVMWALASMDVDHCQVPESLIVKLAVLAGALTLFFGPGTWATPVQALTGAFVISVVVMFCELVLIGIAKASNVQTPPLLMGDGDTLVVAALAAYFGMDALAILFVACMVSVPMHLFQSQVQRQWRRLGHHPAQSGRALPFLPAVFIGVVVTAVLVPRFDLSINSLATHLYLLTHEAVITLKP